MSSHDTAPASVKDYGRKTYRYLRIAIVAVLLAVVFAIVFDYGSRSMLLKSVSAYHYTNAGQLFSGALIMIGICLIAIRGTTDFEDIVLNISGMLAAIVALVPTGCPAAMLGTTFCRKHERLLPRVDLFNANIAALVIAGAMAIGVSLVLARITHQQPLSPSKLSERTKWGLGSAVVVAGTMVAIDRIGGMSKTHGYAAIGLIVGLALVTVGTGLRHLDGGRRGRPWHIAFLTGLAGTFLFFGATLTVAGLWRFFGGGRLGLVIAAIGAVMVLIAGTGLKRWLTRFLSVWRGDDGYCKIYLFLGISMLIGGPLLYLAPGTFETRNFWVELAELLPFGAFWLIQTVEHWERGIVANDTGPYDGSFVPPEPS